MRAGLDTNVLIDLMLLGLGPTLARVLAGEGWTTVFVDREFFDPVDGAGRTVGEVFPFLAVDPVDARLLPAIERDQIAIAGPDAPATGRSAGEASLVHVARVHRPGSTILSNDPHAVGLGRRYGLPVRGTLYVLHLAVAAGLRSADEAWADYEVLRDGGRRPPKLTRAQLEAYLQTGRDPR